MSESSDMPLLTSTEIDEIVSGDSVSIEEFMDEMAVRGLIMSRPGKRSAWRTFKRAVLAPLRFSRAVIAWITWRLWGRAQHELALRRGLERWRQLAGVGASHPTIIDPEKVRRIAVTDSYDHAQALAIHDDVIKNKIVPIELPRPDSVD